MPRGECGEAARGVNRGETMSLAKELRLVRTGACYAKFLRLLQKSTDPSDASLDLIPVRPPPRRLLPDEIPRPMETRSTIEIANNVRDAS